MRRATAMRNCMQLCIAETSLPTRHQQAEIKQGTMYSMSTNETHDIQQLNGSLSMQAEYPCLQEQLDSSAAVNIGLAPGCPDNREIVNDSKLQSIQLPGWSERAGQLRPQSRQRRRSAAVAGEEEACVPALDHVQLGRCPVMRTRRRRDRAHRRCHSGGRQPWRLHRRRLVRRPPPLPSPLAARRQCAPTCICAQNSKGLLNHEAIEWLPSCYFPIAICALARLQLD